MKYIIPIALVNIQVASHISESAITKEYCVLMLFAHMCKAYRVIRSKNALSHLQRKNGCAKSKTMRQKCRQWFSDRYYIRIIPTINFLQGPLDQSPCLAAVHTYTM
jgi:hypothetical protein